MRVLMVGLFSCFFCAVAVVASEDVQIRPVEEGVWLHISSYTFPNGSSYSSNGLIIRDGDSLFLVDTAWGAENTRKLLDAIEAEIGLPVTQAVITHFHEDRIGGADVLKEQGVDVYASAKTQALAAANTNPVPENTLNIADKVGSRVLFGPVEIFYPGAAHSLDNLVVWLPERKLLFGGCAIRSAHAETMGNVADGDIAAWPVTVKRIADTYPDIKRIVPGHGEPAGKELLIHTIAIARQ